MNPKYSEIVEREFRKAKKLPTNSKVTVEFTKKETIVVTVNSGKWIMQIGSDDDNFWFVDDETECDVVTFDFPEDWIQLEENGPW